MFRKALRFAGWTAAGLIGLVVVLYLGALAINWRDREPSAAAVRLTGFHRDRPTVADDNNAFLYLKRWDTDPGRREKLPSQVSEFLEACQRARAECAPAFDRADGLLAQWSAAESTMLDRYVVFTGQGGWREDPSLSAEESIPSYNRASDGQKMLLLRARELAKQGDATSVRELLERDLQFWRMVLQSSDILVSKMIATAMLNRHFEWGNLVLRTLPAPDQAAGIPAGWRLAISDSERSMQRCLAGELLFASENLRNAEADSFGVDEGLPLARMSAWLVRPLFQQQDTINRFAEHYSGVAHAFAVPLADYPRAVDDVGKRVQQTVDGSLPFPSLYNLPGGLVFALAISFDVTRYPVRVGDIEGVRRAALTAATLRAGGVGAKDVSAALAHADQRDPYTDRPFEWEEERRAIVFRGLQSGEGGVHLIYY